MQLLKFFFFAFALSYVKLIDAFDISSSNLTSQWQLAIKSRLGFDVVQSRDRPIYVYFPVAPEVKIRLETASLMSNSCEILVERNTTVAARFSKGYVKSLGNGKIVVSIDIRNIDGISRNRTFYVIDPVQCSYVIGASHHVKQRQDTWHIVTHQDTFDVFSTNIDNCPTDRICRKTYVDTGELVGSSMMNLPGPFGIWAIHSVFKNDSSDGYFFTSMNYQPSRFFVALRLNSKLEMLHKRRINETVKYTVDNGLMMLHYSSRVVGIACKMILDSQLTPLVEVLLPYPEDCFSLAFGYFTNDSAVEIFSCKQSKDNDVDWSSYIRLISTDGKVSRMLKFHDDARRRFRIFKLKDDLHCIVAVFSEETELSFTHENYFITRCIHLTNM